MHWISKLLRLMKCDLGVRPWEEKDLAKRSVTQMFFFCFFFSQWLRQILRVEGNKPSTSAEMEVGQRNRISGGIAAVSDGEGRRAVEQRGRRQRRFELPTTSEGKSVYGGSKQPHFRRGRKSGRWQKLLGMFGLDWCKAQDRWG